MTAPQAPVLAVLEQQVAAATAERVLDPKPRYRRIVDRFECPVCGKTLGETFWNGTLRTATLYVDEGPMIYTPTNTVIRSPRRVFKPCGCISLAADITADPSVTSRSAPPSR